MGKKILQLFSKDGGKWGVEDELFSRYMEYLVESGCPQHTRITYGRAVSHFQDFMQVAIKVNGMSFAEIKRAYLSYHSYLIHGISADNAVAKSVATVKPRRTVGKKASEIYHAAIDSLINFCKGLISEERDFAEHGLEKEIPSREFVVALSLITASPRNRKSSKYDSGLGVKKVTSNKISNHLGRINKSKELEPNKFFPLDNIVELIESASSWRNGALWSLLAGTSVRVSEGLQILWDDIDFSEREIYIIDPSERQNFGYSYRGLSESDIERLSWKGRTTRHTFILEPYGELFFENLERYRDSADGASHNFVFQTNQGKPLFLSDYGKVILAPFKTAASRIYNEKNLSLSKVGLHSLRHAYCYFMRNFVEYRGGYGLSPHELICLTGHADTRSLEVYAKVDRETLFEQLGVANIKRFGQVVGSDAELHVKYLEQRILDWKAKVRAERGEV